MPNYSSYKDRERTANGAILPFSVNLSDHLQKSASHNHNSERKIPFSIYCKEMSISVSFILQRGYAFKMHRLPAWKFTANSRELFNVRAFLHPLVDFHTALKVVWKSTVGVSERQDPCLCCLSLGDALVPHLSSTLVAALAMKWGKWSFYQDRSKTQADTPCIRAMLSTTQLIVREAVIREKRFFVK